MKKLITALCALSFLSSCDDELKLVSRDFSVTLKSIPSYHTAKRLVAHGNRAVDEISEAKILRFYT